jgi:peptidyl-tRNA hydrolase, PTH1 family
VKLVVGLGNPGKKYERTRHNLGFLVIDRIATQNEVVIKKKRCNALIGEWSCNDEKVLLVKPQTYMNRSGEAVKKLIREFGASTEDLVVVYDDLDLPFGRIRIRPQGSAGGHRGLRSIMESVGDAPFYRVRIGIGRPPEGVNAEDYVLEPFDSQERSELNDSVSRAAEAVLTLLKDGAQRAMERFNRAP